MNVERGILAGFEIEVNGVLEEVGSDVLYPSLKCRARVRLLKLDIDRQCQAWHFIWCRE